MFLDIPMPLSSCRKLGVTIQEQDLIVGHKRMTVQVSAGRQREALSWVHRADFPAEAQARAMSVILGYPMERLVTTKDMETEYALKGALETGRPEDQAPRKTNKIAH